MLEKTITLKNASGLHARPGSGLASIAYKYKSTITLLSNGKEINAKEVLDILSANISLGDDVKIIIEGIDAKEAMEEISAYINSLGENE